MTVDKALDVIRAVTATATITGFVILIGHLIDPREMATQRCMHEPLPQPDGTTLCRSYERRRCVGRECGPWEVAK